MGEPVFTQRDDYTYYGVNTRWFRNNYFSAELKIPAGTLKPGKLYFIGMYGNGLPYPGMEDSPGSMLNDVAEFLPVHSPEQDSAGRTAPWVGGAEPVRADELVYGARYRALCTG